MKINIFFGPKEEFIKLLPNDEEIRRLHDLIYEIDKKQRTHVHIQNGEMIDNSKKEYVECLVAYSEDYSTASSNFLENAIDILLKVYKINNIYFHNPPQPVKMLLESKTEFNVDTNTYQYPSVSLRKIKLVKESFSKHIVGQQNALENILSTVFPLTKKKYTEPIVMMFYGSAGVGKTETAKFLSEKFFKQKVFRQQFSMFQTDDFANYLFGEKINGTSLARDLLNRSSNVILFDEFDKAPSVFHSAFYQMFDEGVLVDKHYVADISKAIIICTTNYRTREEIKKSIGDALYSRFDHFIEFQPLTNDAQFKLIEKIYFKKIQMFSTKEKEIIESFDVLTKMLNYVGRFKNVREIDHETQKLMCSVIIKNL
ncbi:AAA family ATPase [Bacillus haynesii]|uniref:AAA family ATPase n=1 Tax=Bacillus haynesii TaxID=1925021 RepID=UPI00227DE057|nr:AAA family ATPase [Bacillus haynesii]MCY7990977.1 AAA family ATPase [Bacillus haynesii]